MTHDKRIFEINMALQTGLFHLAVEYTSYLYDENSNLKLSLMYLGPGTIYIWPISIKLFLLVKQLIRKSYEKGLPKIIDFRFENCENMEF